MKNIANEFIDLTRKTLTEYMKLIFDKSYDQTISDKYIERYMQVRYFNYIDAEKETILRRKVMLSLKQLRAKLLSENPKKAQIIEEIYIFYHYILYLDKTLWCKNINYIIDKMSITRLELSMENNTQFCQKMREQLELNNKKLDDMLIVQESDKFELKIKNLDKINKIYDAKLNYNIKFPEIYSDKSKNKVFESGIVNEDKLFVEYYLISVMIIKDIQKGRFQKQYITEFASSLFEKPSKLERVLGTIENDVILEKLSFKIQYEDFTKNKKNFYDLIRRGFKIAIQIDEEFKYTDEEVEKLEIFEFIIINKNTDDYTRIKKVEKLASKIIGI